MPVCASCGQETPEGFPRCANCGALLEPAAQAREQRKVVTLLFCDVTGSTELGEQSDPEALRALLARYFERMKGIVESHGGSVEKFIGDAVMAVFGVPVAHEDDALRACRAAVEMRDALPELGISGRLGMNTGEVVTGTEERLATGDAVNVAARLEQAAQPGEVLVGEATLALVRAAVEVGQERRLELKGKSEPVAAYSLLAVTGELERRFTTPMVGREHELARLRAVFGQAVHDKSCQLFTILGSAGVGKSRLVSEFVAGLDTRVVRGRCLSYGDGITYWPVVEILKQFGTLPEGDAARPLRSLLGETEESASAVEIAWGFRKLLEQEAQEGPLVCLLDDLHWGEETLLDLVEHVADLSRDAPILLLCMARPELLERRPSWSGGKWNATTVLLEPLDAAETDKLLAELGGVGEALRERIVQVAEGNPLFLEEVLALVRESGGEDLEVPPTIQALLAARLDQLDSAERSVLERGSVEGRVFHRGAVAALADGDGQVEQQLVALVRKELVRPDRTQLPGDDAYRFRHLLIRDAAYEALPKAVRAELHGRFADWLDERAGDLIEADEIVGYHLEQAHRYRVELGLAREKTDELAGRASDRLGQAAERADLRHDAPAAVTLYERTLALAPDHPSAFERELRLIRVRMQAGDLTGALRDADALIERGQRDEDRPRELRARIQRALISYQAEPASTGEFRPLVEEALPLFESLGDDAALADAWLLASTVEHAALRWRPVKLALERVLEHAERIGDRLRADEARARLGAPYMYGPFPVEEAIAWYEAHPSEHTLFLANLAQLEAMRGNFDTARELSRLARERARERGQLLHGAVVSMTEAEAELMAGDAERAAEVALDGVAELERLGEQGWLSTVAGDAAEALYRLGRDEEAWHLTEQAEAAGAADDVITQMLIRQVRAKLLARRGGLAEAGRLAREAVELGQPTDALEVKANSLRDFAIVLTAAKEPDEALAALGEAHRLYEEKGHTVGVARANELRAELVASISE